MLLVVEEKEYVHGKERRGESHLKTPKTLQWKVPGKI
jgi:hypothetical protein